MKKKLGEVLRARGKISTEQLQLAIIEQQGKAIHLGELLVERNPANKADITSALEEVLHVPYVDCSTAVVEASVLTLIPRSVLERFVALPLRRQNKSLIVAMAEPQNLRTIAELRFISGLEVSPRTAFRSEVLEAIRRHYSESETPSPLAAVSDTENVPGENIEFISTSTRQSNREAIQEMQADLRQRKTPAVRLVSEVIGIALSKRASDIHIEPQAGDVAVRIRVDGVLRDLPPVARNLHNSFVSRIKILADMDIAERRTPQDGRFMVNIGSRQIDLRVSTLPTQYGEKVVMRLLESGAHIPTFAELGMPSEVSESLSELLALPQGMLLVTGPTGSGKSTTLYSALSVLRKRTVNIVTVEDPVEYVVPGINQSHVNTKAGLTFASCLRSILRQDPNIIMVGEIRDAETAEIAMKASQTGHLVLSTLHTNDSVTAIIRLTDLGIPSFLINSSITGILAQRLVRKLCSCRSVVPATQDLQDRLVLSGVAHVPEKMPIAVGCENCDHTGYKGRIGIFEFLPLTESLRASVRDGVNVDEMRIVARNQGMRTLQEDALDKLNEGLTSLAEILRVVSFGSITQISCIECGQQVLPNFKFCPHCGTPRHLHAATPERVR